MDYIRRLGTLVLDHRFRRLTEALLRTADEIYKAEGLPFRARWASTFRLLHDGGPLAITELAERLRLTHPAVIGISDDMARAGLVANVADRDDGRRRLVVLTPEGRRLAPRLARVWATLAAVQRERFAAAGCDIVAVLDRVEDSLAARGIADEVLERLASARPRDAKRRRPARALAVLLSTVLALGNAGAAAAQSGQTPRGAETLVNAIADSLVQGYIYDSTARRLADTLRTELRAGAFDAVAADGKALSERINLTLRRVSNDRHLGVRYLRADDVTEVASPGVGRPMRVRRAPSADFAGFIRAELLEGNVGYVDLRGFPGGEAALRQADSAMAAVARAKALIIDVGRNRGGGEEMVRYLSAYLFDRPTHLVSTFARGMDAPRERWTSEQVGGTRLGRVPVYVLTSGSTFSAAESFVFGLKVNNRVTIVGERTGGGGHWGRVIPLVDGFSMFLPVGRTFDPRTGQGWEARGIEPDITAPYERALETALRRISARGSGAAIRS